MSYPYVIKRHPPMLTVLHPGFLPVVISLKAVAAFEYSHGFRKPSTGFPASMSSSLSNAIILAKMGLEKLVPPDI